MASKGQKYRNYPVDLKEEILTKYLSGANSTSLSKEYGISQNTIKMWKYNIVHGKVGKKRGRPKDKNLTLEDYKERYEILKKYQAFLQARREKK